MASDVPRIDIFSHIEHHRMDPPCCYFCDETDDVVFCDGPCSRHFHFVGGKGLHGPNCTPVTLPENNDWRAPWVCQLCSAGKGRCFACGLIGKFNHPTAQESLVLHCAHPYCFSHYHPGCLKVLLMVGGLPERSHPANPESVVCPRHFCDYCKVYRDGIQDFVQCRRCPRSWCHDETPGGVKHLKRCVKDRDHWDVEGWRFTYCHRHALPDGELVPNQPHSS